MTFEEILDQAIAMLQRRGRLTYSALKRQFSLDDAYLEDVSRLLRANGSRWMRQAASSSGLVRLVSLLRLLRHQQPCRAGTPRVHASLFGGENPDLPQCPGRRAQAGHGVVCRPQGAQPN